MRDLLRKEVDWSYLTCLAEYHGFLPLLYTHLKAQASETLPAASLASLHSRFQDNQRNAMFLTGVLVRLLDLFESKGVPALAFKGPVLAQELYGNLALRPFADLDLILPHREVSRAAELMLAQGFVPEPGSAIRTGDDTMDTAGQFAFRDQQGNTIVELHSEVTMRHFPRRPDPGFFFGSARSVSLAGREVRTLDPTSLVLSLCVHGTKDFWASLKWIVDLAEFVRVHATLPWGAVVRQAETLYCQRMLHLGFCLAQVLLGVQLPEELARSCERDREALHMAAGIAARLLEPMEEPSAMARFLFRVHAHPHRWAGLRYALRLTLTPAEEDRASSKLPGPLRSLLRPVRLLRKYGITRHSAPRSS
jgi:hypothetical protein